MGSFLSVLDYFGCKYGRQTIAINPYNTSQMYSYYGVLVAKTLNNRTHVYVCGLVLDCATNAAINILKLNTQGR
ncbi:hypothetical protein C7B80_09705 [Cyanosarcina cf. burmensis CCALA 770]|nr:hypothetical protein C7B80_09705 [Cyanosarcina cf. burmensis CCALA 770]